MTQSPSYLSLDIGGTLIKRARLCEEGKIINRYPPLPTPRNEAGLKHTIYQVIDRAQDQVDGVAISSTGIFDKTTGKFIRSGSFPFMVGHSLSQAITEDFGLPCSILNDGQAALYGELWKGRLQGINHGMMLTIGTGLVASYIFNGQAYFGAHEMAGELSSYTQNEQESYFPVRLSSAHFFNLCYEALGQDNRGGEYIFDLLDQGEHTDLLALFKEYCHDLALMLFNMQVALDPEIILVSGGIVKQDRFVKELKKAHQEIYASKSERVLGPMQTQVERSLLQNDANLVGALYYHLNQA